MAASIAAASRLSGLVLSTSLQQHSTHVNKYAPLCGRCFDDSHCGHGFVMLLDMIVKQIFSFHKIILCLNTQCLLCKAQIHWPDVFPGFVLGNYSPRPFFAVECLDGQDLLLDLTKF